MYIYALQVILKQSASLKTAEAEVESLQVCNVCTYILHCGVHMRYMYVWLISSPDHFHIYTYSVAVPSLLSTAHAQYLYMRKGLETRLPLYVISIHIVTLLCVCMHMEFSFGSSAAFLTMLTVFMSVNVLVLCLYIGQVLCSVRDFGDHSTRVVTVSRKTPKP